MSRSIYILGAPGTGKSTVAAALIDALGLSVEPPVKLYPHLHANPLTDGSGELRGYSLGTQREHFPGTDALSLAVLPYIVEWLPTADLPEYVIGEGTRLAVPKFFMEIDKVAPLLLVELYAPEEVLRERRKDRPGIVGTAGKQKGKPRPGRTGDLDPGFVAQATARSANAANLAWALGYDVLRINAREPVAGIVDRILFKKIRWVS